MSLVVWLPLNGDLHNQGLSNISINQYSATIDNNGKIGKCYSFNGNTDGIQYTNFNLKDISQISVCFWVYTTSTTINNAFCFGTQAGYFQFAIGNNVLIVRDTSTGVSGTRKEYFLGSFTTNTWTHICCIYNKGVITIYKNGVLFSTNITVNNSAFVSDDIANCTIGSVWYPFSSTYSSNNKLNDFRIYNHALSSKEVEEISKGLVLHYPLNNNGLGNTNLALNTSYEMRPYTISSYYTGTNNNSTDFFNLSVGDTYTCRAKITAGEKNTCLRIQFYTDENTRTSIFGNWIAAGTTGYSTITSTLTAEQRNYSLMQICLQSGVNTSTSGMYGELKLEKGSMATPWCPNNINTNIIYDTSGYCNNGIVVGDITTITPSPRYNVAAHLESSSPTTNNGTGLTYIQTAFRLTAPTQMTICWWGHPESGLNGNSNHAAWCTSASSSAPTDYDQTAFHHRDKRFDICLNSASSTSLSLRFDNYTLNEWHYYSVTYDGKIAILYKDGIETNRSTISSSEAPLKTFSYLYIGFSKAGGVYRKTLGSYSDFRIYATALSAQQIKELYTTSMQIDSSGNVFARELVEL